MVPGTIAHEFSKQSFVKVIYIKTEKKVICIFLVHALGFWHEQSRPDRDNHIKVLYENIIEGKIFGFYKCIYYFWKIKKE